MNDLEVQMLGLSRSGNHAIADWMFRQAQGEKLLLNCAEGKTNPYLSCRPLGDGPGWQATTPDVYSSGRAGRHRDLGLLLHTYEDSWLRHAFSRDLEAHHDGWVGPSRRRVALIVLRDPFNLFASRLRAGCTMSPHTARRIWKQHARIATGRAPRMPVELRVALYNDWAADPGYRRDLAGWLGLRFTDSGADRVPGTLGGSSFDGTRYDGMAEQMPTASRWRRYVGDPDYLRLFDPETVALATRLFGPPPAGIEAAVAGSATQARATHDAPPANGVASSMQ